MYNVIGMWKTSGFTLIEFMVVMGLVAILSGVAMSNFVGSQRRGRDVRRQQDLNQYRVALENYASVNGGVYPASSADGQAGNSSGIFSPSGVLAPYLSGFSKDPQAFDYYYRGDSGGTTWVLRACQEVTRTAYEACSNGKAGITTKACALDLDNICDVP